MNYYHHVPGRLRIKTSKVKGKDSHAEALRTLLGAHNGIRRVDVSTLTGSVVIEYERELLTGEQLLALVTEHGYFDRATARTSEQHVHAQLSRTGESVGKAIFSAMLERTFEGSAVSLIAALL
jgi:hypothetical protein